MEINKINAFLPFGKIFQFEMQLCADLPDTPHMNRGQFRGPHGQIKTSVRQIFDHVSAQAVTKLGVQGKKSKIGKNVRKSMKTNANQ